MLNDAQQTILRWRNDPVAFVKEVFGAVPEPWQIEALMAVVTNDKITIRSGHGVGKSTLLAWVLIWFMSTNYPVKVACTAPSSHQLYDVLWAEVRLWLRRAIPAIEGQFVVKMDRIELVGGGDSFASARTARAESPDALQGFHSEHMLFLIDEAPGVPNIIFEVAAGAMSTPGAKQILTGNPTRASGYFKKSHDPGSGFYKMKVSCEESSRVSRDWIKEMEEEYGRDSNIFRYRVLGEFPTSDVDVFIPMELIQSAITRDVAVGIKSIPVWGLDVARYGSDRSCLIKRYDNAVLEMPKVWSGLSTMELTGAVLNEYTFAPVKPSAIYVDVIGIGSGVYDRLEELELPVVAVNVSESPSFAVENAFRMRDELWVMARKWLESKLVKFIDHPGLVAELSQVRSSFTSSGKIRIESKDDYKRRGFRSPDVADAFVLTFAYQSSIGMGTESRRMSDWKVPIKRELQVVP